MQIDKRFITLGVACFFFFLVTMFPARTLFAIAMPDAVQGFGVQGSVWNGSARILNVAGQQFRNTEWNLAIGGVLLGRFGGDLKTRWGGGFAEGNATVSLGGTLRVVDAQTAFDAATLGPLLRIPDIGGQVSMQISELELVDNWPRRLTGTGEIRNLSSPMMGRGAADLIGNVAIEFDTATETEANTVTGRIRDTGGPLEIKGTLILTAPGNYDLEARLKPRPNAPKSTTQNLRFLGPPETGGNYVFKLAGSI